MAHRRKPKPHRKAKAGWWAKVKKVASAGRKRLVAAAKRAMGPSHKARKRSGRAGAAPAAARGGTKVYLTEQSDDRVYVRQGSKRVELEEPAGVVVTGANGARMRVALEFDYGWRVKVSGGGRTPPATVKITQRDGDASAVLTLAPGATVETFEG